MGIIPDLTGTGVIVFAGTTALAGVTILVVVTTLADAAGSVSLEITGATGATGAGVTILADAVGSVGLEITGVTGATDAGVTILVDITGAIGLEIIGVTGATDAGATTGATGAGITTLADATRVVGTIGTGTVKVLAGTAALATMAELDTGALVDKIFGFIFDCIFDTRTGGAAILATGLAVDFLALGFLVSILIGSDLATGATTIGPENSALVVIDAAGSGAAQRLKFNKPKIVPNNKPANIFCTPNL